MSEVRPEQLEMLDGMCGLCKKNFPHDELHPDDGLCAKCEAEWADAFIDTDDIVSLQIIGRRYDDE